MTRSCWLPVVMVIAVYDGWQEWRDGVPRGAYNGTVRSPRLSVHYPAVKWMSTWHAAVSCVLLQLVAEGRSCCAVEYALAMPALMHTMQL